MSKTTRQRSLWQADIGLPDMDGYQFAREIRPLPELAGAARERVRGAG